VVGWRGEVMDPRTRETSVGFVGGMSPRGRGTFQQLFLHAMTHVGEDWDEEPIAVVREDWVVLYLGLHLEIS
jgi:hypothetical protein